MIYITIYRDIIKHTLKAGRGATTRCLGSGSIKGDLHHYTGSEYVVEALVDKLLGRSPFKGQNPVDRFCGYWDARL